MSEANKALEVVIVLFKIAENTAVIARNAQRDTPNP